MKDGKDQDKEHEKGGERPEEHRRQGIPVREFAKKLFSTGADAMAATEEGLRSLVGDVNPREAVSGLIESVTKGTDTVQLVLMREARRYLEAINLQDELGRVLSNYTIEVNARINFVPRDKSAEKKKGKGAKGRETGSARLETESYAFKLTPKEARDDAQGEAADPKDREKK